MKKGLAGLVIGFILAPYILFGAVQSGYFNTLTSSTGKVFTYSNTLTLAGTDGSTLNVGTGGTLGTAAYTASTAYAPAAGSSNIVTIGAAEGTSLVVTGALRTQALGPTAMAKVTGTGGQSGFTPGASKTITFTMNAESVMFMITDQSAGKAAFGFVSWSSATVTLLAGSDTMFQATSTPGAAEVGIFKSSNSYIVSVKTGSGFGDILAITLLGGHATAVTDPA